MTNTISISMSMTTNLILDDFVTFSLQKQETWKNQLNWLIVTIKNKVMRKIGDTSLGKLNNDRFSKNHFQSYFSEM